VALTTYLGAANGIVASGVYRHFARKVDLLAAAATCGVERIRAGTGLALAAAGSPAEALELLLRAHIALCVEHRHLIGILAHEGAQLPEKERTALADLQADSLATWVAALGAIVPDRPPEELTFLVHATHSMIYLVARSRCAELWPGLPARLAAMGMTMLLSG
jgi:AcrR family transcriptional regulator